MRVVGPLLMVGVISLAPFQAAVAGMSDYGEAVTKIAFYEKFALLPRNRSVAGLLAHNRREAQNFLLKRVKSHPKDYKAYYLLAYLYEYNDDHRRYGPGFDMPRAIELYQKSLALKEDYVWNHVNLGWLYRLAGRTDEAIGHFERAQMLDSRNALTAADLAFAYLDKAMLDRARDVYEVFLRGIEKLPDSLRFKTFDDLLRAYQPPPTKTP